MRGEPVSVQPPPLCGSWAPLGSSGRLRTRSSVGERQCWGQGMTTSKHEMPQDAPPGAPAPPHPALSPASTGETATNIGITIRPTTAFEDGARSSFFRLSNRSHRLKWVRSVRQLGLAARHMPSRHVSVCSHCVSCVLPDEGLEIGKVQ